MPELSRETSSVSQQPNPSIVIAQRGSSRGDSALFIDGDRETTPTANQSGETIEETVTAKRRNVTPPAGGWDKYFSQPNIDSNEIREMTSILFDAQQYKEVIELVESALINGHSQPWMYEVLALTMKIEKYPNDEVERVLLSITDFSPSDVPSLLYSATYLSRFDAFERALAMCRQASQLAPTQPEPYALGLKLAERLDDPEAIAWAAAGVLKYDWSRGYEKRHNLAKDQVNDQLSKLDATKKGEAVASLREALVHGERRDLMIELVWSGDADLDLMIDEPCGSTCGFSQRQTIGGGALVHDGAGPDPENSYEKYICAYGMPGIYKVHVRHIWGKVVGYRATLKVTRYKGTDEEIVESIPVLMDKREKLFKVSLLNGRRRDLAFVPPEPLSVAERRSRSRKQTLALLQRGGADSQRLLEQFDRSRRNSANNASTFAIGFTPMITLLRDGVTADATATISADRRYVKISTVPIFSTITDVFTFSFQGGGGGGNAGGGAGGAGANFGGGN